MKPAAQQPKPLTEEQKLEQIARFLSQKREAFATGILFNLVQGQVDKLPVAGCIEAVSVAVKMADALIEKLYPVPNPSEGKDK